MHSARLFRAAVGVLMLTAVLPDARAFETQLKQIAEIFGTSPIWNPPMGVDPSLNGGVLGPAEYSPYAKKLPYRPIGGYIMFGQGDER